MRNVQKVPTRSKDLKLLAKEEIDTAEARLAEILAESVRSENLARILVAFLTVDGRLDIRSSLRTDRSWRVIVTDATEGMVGHVLKTGNAASWRNLNESDFQAGDLRTVESRCYPITIEEEVVGVVLSDVFEGEPVPDDRFDTTIGALLGQITEVFSTKEKPHGFETLTRDYLTQNRAQIVFGASAVSAQVDSIRDHVRRNDNQIEKDVKKAIEQGLTRIEEDATLIAEAAMRAETLTDEEVAIAEESRLSFRESFMSTVTMLADHERLGEIAARAGFVAVGTTFGAIIGFGFGMLLAGPVTPALIAGGTVGTLIGKMFAGESKPGATGEKIAKTIEGVSEPSSSADS